MLRDQTGEVWGVAWSPDGSQIASANEDGTVRVWNAVSGDERQVLWGHTAPVKSVAWSPDGKQIASAGDDGTVRLWDAASGAEQRVLQSHEGIVWSVAWFQDEYESWIVAGGDDGIVRVWDSPNGDKPILLSGHSSAVLGVTVDPYGTIVSAGDDGKVSIYDTTSHAEILTIQVAQNGEDSSDVIQQVAWSGDGTRIATAGADSTVRIWDAMSGTMRLVFRGHESPIYRVSWSADSKRIVSYEASGTILVWNTDTGVEQFSLAGSRYSGRIAWSTDGSRIAYESEGAVRLVDAANGNALQTITLDSCGLASLAWSPDSSQLAFACYGDNTTRVWDVMYAKVERLKLHIHSRPVTGVAWSPDGTRIVSVSEDGTARIWEVASGLEKSILRFGDLSYGDITWGLGEIAWRPDGKQIALVSGYIQVYYVNIADLLNMARPNISRSLTLEERQTYGLPTNPTPTPVVHG